MTAGFRQIAAGDGDAVLWAEFPCDWRRPEADGAYRMYWRDRDGFGQLLPRPDAGEIPAFYDVPYYTHTTEAAAVGQGGILRRIIVHLAWRVDRGVDCDAAWWHRTLPAAPADVLEIGCGDGGTLDLLAQHGHNAVGVEPDPRARETARSRGADVRPGTAEDLPDEIRGRTFDLIFLSHVLEHCLDPEAAVRNAAALLKPGGRLVIEVPNNACLGRDVFGPTWYWLDVPRHLNFFTRQSLCDVLEAAGLRIDQIEYSGYCRQFQDGWQTEQRKIARIFDLPARDGIADQLRYLARTARADDDLKYDSVRVSAVRMA